MSNRITIEPTKFIDVRSGHITFGVRVFDDYGQSYDNTWNSIPLDDLDVLKQVMASDDVVIIAMLDHVKENQLGVYIDEYYTWDKIEHLFKGS